MIYFSKRCLTDAIVWVKYSPDIEVADSLMHTLKGFVRQCGLPADLFVFSRMYVPLSEQETYAYASVESFSGRLYELAYNGSEYLFYSTSDVGADEGWCFKIPLNKDGTLLKLDVLLESVGSEFLVIFANLLQN